MNGKMYIAIDLKSYYASVECIELGLNPIKTNLVVADKSKTDKTICLAVTPSLKKYGISSRTRLFEVVSKVKEINEERKKTINGKDFKGSSYLTDKLDKDPYLELDYIAAPPRMRHYIEYSTKIIDVYLRHVSPKDMYVYSIDEVFIDATKYLQQKGISAKKFAKIIIQDILKYTGITAAAGVGTNMYLCKIAMDIWAKRIQPDKDGVRVAELDENSFRKNLWNHRPLTDFWRIGSGIAKRLSKLGIYTMGDIAKCSIGKKDQYYNAELLYENFGINAELLIDHAWGYEPVEMKHVKGYSPMNSSISSGQVLNRPYAFEEARLVLKEMAESLALDLHMKRLRTRQIVLTISYDIENAEKGYKGETKIDIYGRVAPKKCRGTVNFPRKTNLISEITKSLIGWFDDNADRNLTLRRFNLSANKLEKDDEKEENVQLSFLDFGENALLQKDPKELEREERLQEATLLIQRRFGKNALLKGMNLENGATRRSRNDSIGGHKA